MTLWRVQVGGISHRYVNAEDADQATELVRQAIMDSLDLTATKADPIFASTYETSGPVRRKRILAALDGLTSPRSRQDVGIAKRQLARLMRWSDETALWVQDQISDSPPPPDPKTIDQMVTRAEQEHVEGQRRLLRQANIEIRPFNDA